MTKPGQKPCSLHRWPDEGATWNTSADTKKWMANDVTKSFYKSGGLQLPAFDNITGGRDPDPGFWHVFWKVQTEWPWHNKSPSIPIHLCQHGFWKLLSLQETNLTLALSHNDPQVHMSCTGWESFFYLIKLFSNQCLPFVSKNSSKCLSTCSD